MSPETNICANRPEYWAKRCDDEDCPDYGNSLIGGICPSQFRPEVVEAYEKSKEDEK